jgi:hypothetical protein
MLRDQRRNESRNGWCQMMQRPARSILWRSEKFPFHLKTHNIFCYNARLSV